MSRAARIEALRLRLKEEAEAKNWEEEIAIGIVLVAKEMNTTIDDVLKWTIMRFNTVCKLLKDFYERAKSEAAGEQTLNQITLGG